MIMAKIKKIIIYGTRKFGFPERAGMTSVIGQIDEELEWVLTYQKFPRSSSVKGQKTRVVP
jgi:hypothetical protein